MTSQRRGGVLSILGGTAGAQAMALASAPLISRLFPPGEYGPFAVALAAALPLSAFLALRLDFAVPFPSSDDESLAVARTGLEAAAALGALGVLLAWAARRPLASLLHLADPGIVLWIPAIAAVTAWYAVLSQVAIRSRLYQAIGRRNLLQGAAVVLLQVAAGLLHLGSGGLAAGYVLGQSVGIASLWLSLRHQPWRDVALDRGHILRTYRKYPLVLAPSGFVNALGLQLPLVLVSNLYGADASGWMGMTQKVLALPIGVFGLAIAQVFLGEFGNAHRREGADLRPMFLRVSGKLAAVGAVVAAVVLLLGPWGFGWVLGGAWRRSGLYAQALALGMAAQMVAAPLSQSLIVLGRVWLQFAWDVLRLVVCAGAVLAASRLGASDLQAMWALGGAIALTYLVSWAFSWSAVRAGANGARHPQPATEAAPATAGVPTETTLMKEM